MGSSNAMVPPEGTDACKSAVGAFAAQKPLANSSDISQRAAKEFSSPLTETLLETAIEVAKQRMCEAPTRVEKLSAWREMCGLIDQRTPARRRFMERMRGLV